MKRGLPWLAAVGFMSAAAFACSDGAEGAAEDAADAGVADAATASITPDAAEDPADSGAVGDAASAPDAAEDAALADAGEDADAAPPQPAVRFVGRFDTTDPLGPKVAWPGARVIVRFSGTELRVKLAEESFSDVGPSRYDVVVDGAPQPTLTTAVGTNDYVLAANLAAGTHVVEVVRRTESLVGVTQFRGFEYPNGGQLLAPPPAPDRRIEFLGDSSSNGYGIECASPLMTFSGATENERKAFPALAAAALSADHHDLGFAGKGVLRNYDANDTQVFSLLYPRTLPETAASVWSYARFPAHVVWMTLGGNDWDNPGNRPPPDLAAFQTKYAELVALVRAAQPQAQLVLAVAPSLSDDYPPGYNALTNMTTALTNVRNARIAAGDANVHLHVFTRTTYPDDVTGCEYHPNAAFHAKLGVEVAAKIKAITGWP